MNSLELVLERSEDAVACPQHGCAGPSTCILDLRIELPFLGVDLHAGNALPRTRLADCNIHAGNTDQACQLYECLTGGHRTTSCI